MELEHHHDLLVHDLPPSDELPHLLTSPISGVFIFWPGVVMPSLSAVSCYAANCASFRQLWLVSVDSQDIYLECCQIAHWTVRTGAACKLLAATVKNRQQLAELIADIVHTQPRFGLTTHLRENISRHERLLVNMFPCLNPFSARAILSRTSLVHFLSLDQSNISSQFPWLPETAAANIADVTATSFQLSQFVNTNQVDQIEERLVIRDAREMQVKSTSHVDQIGDRLVDKEIREVEVNRIDYVEQIRDRCMNRDVREMEVNRIMFGTENQMKHSGFMWDAE